MIAFPNCKINLGLYIENKRSDGFHNIKTVFYPIELTDVLEIIESDTSHFVMSMSGIPVNGDFRSNLCYKAYSLLKNDFSLPAIKIHLHKAIPHGAGLGGGSSDAAFTIKMLNNIFNLNLNNKQMQQYASKLGSDCTFFIENKTVIAKEKGDVFENIEISLNDYHIIIAKPNIGVSTPASYKETLYNNGAIYAAMSGSGAAVYGIFKEIPQNLRLPDGSFSWEK
jgi:4-diphosphocytidyl-2-C-methyl-D-erythritol kinase